MCCCCFLYITNTPYWRELIPLVRRSSGYLCWLLFFIYIFFFNYCTFLLSCVEETFKTPKWSWGGWGFIAHRLCLFSLTWRRPVVEKFMWHPGDRSCGFDWSVSMLARKRDARSKDWLYTLLIEFYFTLYIFFENFYYLYFDNFKSLAKVVRSYLFLWYINFFLYEKLKDLWYIYETMYWELF